MECPGSSQVAACRPFSLTEPGHEMKKSCFPHLILVCVCLLALVWGCDRQGPVPGKPGRDATEKPAAAGAGPPPRRGDAAGGAVSQGPVAAEESESAAAGRTGAAFPGYTGSAGCRECHERFYTLWAPSRHGLAMQPFTPEFARAELTPQKEEVRIGDCRYRVEIDHGRGWVVEHGPSGEKRYEMLHVLGGKNVYYFLTPLERGRLQTLPVSYDVRRRTWFDTAASGVRHFPRGAEDEPVHWKEWPYTFNTACHSCHVSQLSLNYDLNTDTYRTVWAEPGINCEACHGPGEEHVRVCREAPAGEVPRDLKTTVITTRAGSTAEQVNAACAPCHTKGAPITPSFPPGESYFDHYDLVALEHPDFHPDGRDLGENYTYTLWLMNPCVKSGRLDCLHCHTSSGRFRQGEAPDQACLPCHAERVADAAAHTRHPAGSPGSRCIACHMPVTEFARMRRSDHSLLPPAPAATLAFSSPNACNLCHQDRDAAWADQQVRAWHGGETQARVLYRAGLIEAARRRDWGRLPEMLTYIRSRDRDEVVSASLLRLLQACGEDSVRPAVLDALRDPSPLVRSSACSWLAVMPAPEAFAALLRAAGDGVRLVRVRAATALSVLPGRELDRISEEERDTLERATREYLDSLTSRPDHWASHFNLGNFHLNRGDNRQALAAYETAVRFDPRNPMPLVNASIAGARLGEMARVDGFLEKALALEPDHAAAHFNLGLLRAEQGKLPSAEEHLRAALRAAPEMAEAAYNLGLLLVPRQPAEAVRRLRQAYDLSPNPRYGTSLAFYVRVGGDDRQAGEILRQVVGRWPAHLDAYLLLGDICEKQGKGDESELIYRAALNRPELSREQREVLESKIGVLRAATRDR